MTADRGSRTATCKPALDDLHREFKDHWDITVIRSGYRAIPHDEGSRTPAPRYGRTPAELAESIRMAERQP